MEKYIVTVDTGGTKTKISVFNYDGKLLKQVDCSGVGVVGNAELEELTDNLEQLSSIIPLDSVSNVVVNLGGANTEQIKKAVSLLFSNAKTEVYRESSGVIMKAICQMEDVDVLLMAGTGVICLSNGSKGSMITDAWCPVIGDKGSGYWIGVEAISRSLIALENGDELSPLAKHITGRQEPFPAFENTIELMQLRDNVRANFMPLERMKTASFAKVAAEYAREGDRLALGIFHEAGEKLSETVIRGINIAGCKFPASVLVSGGLSRCYDLWGKSFEKSLKSRCFCRLGEADMTKGMLYYIKNEKRN